MKRVNWLLVFAVVLLTVLPLWLIRKPVDGGELFTGSDGQGQQAIQQIAPHYQPWFESFMTPPGKEIESLLFALQAALGAGIIGYWLGVAVTRDRLRRTAENRPADPEQPHAD